MPDSTANEASAYATEIKPLKVHVTAAKPSFSILERFESISTVFLVSAFVLRLMKNLKAAVAKRKTGLTDRDQPKPPEETNICVNLVDVAEKSEHLSELLKKCEPVRRFELIEAENLWYKLTQASAYAE